MTSSVLPVEVKSVGTHPRLKNGFSPRLNDEKRRYRPQMDFLFFLCSKSLEKVWNITLY